MVSNIFNCISLVLFEFSKWNKYFFSNTKCSRSGSRIADRTRPQGLELSIMAGFLLRRFPHLPSSPGADFSAGPSSPGPSSPRGRLLRIPSCAVCVYSFKNGCVIFVNVYRIFTRNALNMLGTRSPNVFVRVQHITVTIRRRGCW